jgi:hypothetical protein
MHRLLALLLAGLALPVAAQAQADAEPLAGRLPALDSIRPPATTRTIAVRRDAILPHRRIVAYYGNPLSTRMGILGEIPPDQMMRRLEAIAAEWTAADSARPAMPALHLIVTVAQAAAGGDGMYRLRHGDALIGRVAEWAESKGWLLFLDVQVGRSTVAAEIPRLIPWLKKPWVHLALDPEFAMPADQVPGKRIGTLDAKDINHAQALLAQLVDEGQLPPKILVVHRFTERMVTNHRAIETDPRVQVVIDMDGFGTPALKRNIYDYIVNRRPVQFAGLKLFYKNDKPLLSPREVLASFFPTPVYIQYQ